MKRNSLFLTGTAVVLTAAFAVGCGNSSTGNAAEPAAAAASEAVPAAESTAAGADDGSEDAAAAYTGEKTTVIAVTSATPRPFTYYDEDNNLTGHNIELTEAIFAKLPQYELKWEITDFTSMFPGLDSGRYQLGVNNFAMNDERKEKYLFSDPMFVDEGVVVANKDVKLPDKDVLSYSDLAGLNYIGAVGTNFSTFVENYNANNPDNQIIMNYSDDDMAVKLQDIASGKYDISSLDAPMWYGYYQPEFNLDLQVKGIEGLTKDDARYSYFILPKGQEQLAADLNKALYEVIEEGTSKEICEKYFGKDYSPDLSVLTGGN